MDRRARVTSISLVLGAVVSVQSGAAAATTLFERVGPAGAVLLRTGFAAMALVALWRPAFTGHTRREMRLVAGLGLVLAAMNLTFYLALDRIPLGIAVTFEFIGPLGVALVGSRRPADLVWVAFAAGGIALLSPGIGGSLDTLGVAFALVAGGFWAAYIVLTAKIGRAFERGDGLALAMVISAVVLVPSGIVGGGTDLVGLGVLAVGLAVGLLSSAIPYSLELEALRRLPESTFGVLMSLEPAVAALVGFAFLDQTLPARELVAIALVVIASAGALGTARAPAPVEA
jgi:inner membrane transporter RhtA